MAVLVLGRGWPKRGRAESGVRPGWLGTDYISRIGLVCQAGSVQFQCRTSWPNSVIPLSFTLFPLAGLVLARLAQWMWLTWKVSSLVSWISGILALWYFGCHVITKLIFVRFNKHAEISANQANSTHVISPIISTLLISAKEKNCKFSLVLGKHSYVLLGCVLIWAFDLYRDAKEIDSPLRQ